MEGKEQSLLAALGWSAKGLIASTASSAPASGKAGAGSSASTSTSTGATSRKGKAPFRLLLCDMDGAFVVLAASPAALANFKPYRGGQSRCSCAAKEEPKSTLEAVSFAPTFIG